MTLQAKCEGNSRALGNMAPTPIMNTSCWRLMKSKKREEKSETCEEFTMFLHHQKKNQINKSNNETAWSNFCSGSGGGKMIVWLICEGFC